MSLKISSKILIYICVIIEITSCNSNTEFLNLESNKCEICNEHFKSNFKLLYPKKKLKTKGNESAIDGPNWDLVAKRRFGNSKKINLLKESKFKEFKSHLFCYLGTDLKTMKNFIPYKMIDYEFKGDDAAYLKILVQVESWDNFGNNGLVWNGSRKMRMEFRRINSKFIFIGDSKIKKQLVDCK